VPREATGAETGLAAGRIDPPLPLVEREMARRFFPHYCKYVFGWEIGECPMHLEWDEHIAECRAADLYAGIQAPRNHGKTQRMARAWPEWMLGRSTMPRLGDRQNLRLKLFANTDKFAARTIQQVERDITSNDRVRAVFPDMRPDRTGDWTKHAFYLRREDNERDPSYEGYGIGSTATSGRADGVILDDVCDLSNSILHPAEREKVLTVLDADMIHLCEPWAWIVDIGTAWHELDANAKLMKRAGWKWTVYRVQKHPGAKMVPLWPSKWGLKELRRRQLNNPREFDRGFNNWAWTEDEGIVDWTHVEKCMRPDLAPFERAFQVRVSGVGYDLALSKDSASSFFVAFALGMSGAGRFQPLEIVHKQGVPFRQQTKTALRLHNDLDPRPSVHMVENNGYQDALVQQIRLEGESIPVEAFTTGKQKWDPYVGLPSYDPSFAAGEWVIGTKGGHDGDTLPECECPQCCWLRELKHFPAATTDLVMGCWFIFNRMRRLRAVPGSTGETEPAEFGQAFEDPGSFADIGDGD